MGGSEAQGDLDESSVTFRKEGPLPRVLSLCPCPGLASSDDIHGQGCCADRRPHPLGQLQPWSGVCALGSRSQINTVFTSGAATFMVFLFLSQSPRQGGRVSFFSSNTCILFLAPSTGHPVPKPEPIHLLEHGQKLWTGARGLPCSSGPGRSR